MTDSKMAKAAVLEHQRPSGANVETNAKSVCPHNHTFTSGSSVHWNNLIAFIYQEDAMAGDWIKMRAELHTHPKIVRMSSALKADRLRVVGGLHSAWCLFDVHSTDGLLHGYTPETLDDLIGFPGFARAMIAVGWLEEDGENLVMPRFDAHNGQSAKRRAQDADRKKKSRKMSACDADKKRTREEKRRYKRYKPRERRMCTTCWRLIWRKRIAPNSTTNSPRRRERRWAVFWSTG
ncbi:TPA: hypothetical protein ACH7SC_000851 [Escherichia coli]